MPSHRSFVAILLLFLAAALMFFAYTPARGQEPPNPIDPSNGEESLLDVVNSIPVNDIQNALDNYPVPYVVVAAADGATPTIANNKAGAPTNINADLNKSTGKGGHDIKVEVNTVLLPTPRLELQVARLGVAPFAKDLIVLIAFPFDAFNGEDATLPGDPNLFIGYETSLAGGAPGGIAPAIEKFTFTPDILSGTDHLFSMNMLTTGASNPLRFISGHFDGTSATGLLNVSAISALTEPVPSSITVGLDVGESPIAMPGDTDTSFGLSWDASAPSKVTFDYFEEEDGLPSFSNPTDYNTTVTFDLMPMSEDLTLTLDEDARALTLSHRASAVINAITVLHERADGLAITGIGSDVPTEVDLTVDTAGAVTLNVNANTLDLRLRATQTDDFDGTNPNGFFGFKIGYVDLDITNAPDLTASYVPADDRFRVQATNPGESIGSVGLIIDDGPTPVIDGGLDMNVDGTVDGADDGSLHGVEVIDGGVDFDGDGGVDGDDDGAFAASVPIDAAIINGQIDLNADGTVDANDKGDLTVLKLAPSWEEIPIHHIFSLADDGIQGTAAARLVNVSEGSFDLDAAAVFDGMLDINNDGGVDGNDDGIIAVDVDVIDGNIDVNGDGFITGTDDDRMFGHEIFDGKMDIDDDEDIDGNDDGQLNGHTYRLGTTAAAPLQGAIFTEPGSTLLPGQDIDAICNVDDIPAGTINFQIGFPPPDISISYKIDPPQGIDEISCAGHVGTVAFELLLSDLPPEFEFDFDPDSHLTVTAEDGSGTANSDRVGAVVVRLCDDPNMDGVCVTGQNGTGLPQTGGLMGEPLRDARARADDIPSFEGRWGDSSASVIAGRLDTNGDAIVDLTDDKIFTGFRILDGLVDINGSGNVTGADDGRITGKPVVNGFVDVDKDGDVDANDNGTIAGSGMKFDTGVPDATLFLDGMQFDVSTDVGLAPLAPADPSSDHFAAFTDEGAAGDMEKRIRGGAFGIDEFAYSSDDGGRGVAVNYNANEDHRLLLDFDSAFGGRFFPQFAIDLNLTIDDVPQTWSFFTDMATELVYDGSSNIDSITIDGTIDNTNDANDTNGTVVEFDFDPIPAHVAFHLAPDPKPVIAGRLDVKAPAGIDGVDDDIYAGVRIINGEVDIDGSGAVDGSDNGILVGVAVMTGRLDTNRDGAVNGDDNASLAGAMLRMSEALPEISFSLTSTNNILGIPLQLIEFSILNIPARWDINWGGGRFLVEARDTSDNPAPMGSINAQVSTASSQAAIDVKVLPFTQDGDQLGGPILGAPGASGGCRINYSQFLQEIDKRYYNAAPDPDPSTVFSRLRNLYCDSEQLDPGEDHVLVRLGGPALIDYGSLRVSGFQHISWTPDANGGQFILRAPTPGLHPIFFGAEKGGLFATLQIANIPDQIIVDIDDTQSIRYDATDDLDASIQQIDGYLGPLPTAQDGQFAARFVLDFPGPVVSTTDFVHIGWNFAFPNGGAFFNSSEPFDILFLIQDGSARATAGVEMEDLHAAWGLDLFSFDEVSHIGFDVPCPTFDDPFRTCPVEVPVEWELVDFKAGVDNDADAESTSLPLAENPAKTAIDGFLAVYQMTPGIEDLSPPAGVGHAASEYLPFVTLEGKGFGIGTIEAQLTLDPLSPNLFCIVFPACLSLNVPVDISGTVTLDIWSNVLTNKTFGPIEDPITGTDIIPEVGFRNRPDYQNNNPFHIVPDGLDNVRLSLEPGTLVINFDGFHDFDDHIDPFAP